MSIPQPKPLERSAVFVANGAPIHYEVCGAPIEAAGVVFIWGHGWGQDLNAFRATAASFADAANVLLDFPGFGASPPPPQGWGTQHYADACFELLASLALTGKKVAWVGHSFGGRVGIQLAARHPGAISGLCLVASAGLPRRRTALQTAKHHIRIRTFKLLRMLPLSGPPFEWLRARMGSADYRNAGAMRSVLVSVVNENLTDVARKISCPCLLIYGENDTETPPDIGERLARLIPNSTLSILPNNDHYSVLGNGRHLVVKRLVAFLEKLN